MSAKIPLTKASHTAELRVGMGQCPAQSGTKSYMAEGVYQGGMKKWGPFFCNLPQLLNSQFLILQANRHPPNGHSYDVG